MISSVIDFSNLVPHDSHHPSLSLILTIFIYFHQEWRLNQKEREKEAIFVMQKHTSQRILIAHHYRRSIERRFFLLRAILHNAFSRSLSRWFARCFAASCTHARARASSDRKKRLTLRLPGTLVLALRE